MPQRSPQQENHTPVIGIALTLLLSIALATGCSASTAGNEAPPGEPTPELASTGTPDGPQEPQSAPAEDTNQQETEAVGENRPVTDDGVLSYRDVPAFEGNPYVYVNDGEPTFTDEQRAAEPGHEHYGELDELGRCTAAFAVVGPETQPTEKRGSIGEVRPSGWQMAKYDFVEGKYLFNRCHLLGYQLTGENANERNLITGTRYLNVQGMLPFENAVADYVDATGNHVLMAVMPVFEGSELVARGVHMMAESVEDGGEGVAFNVFCYNVQPGVVIDYGTGESMLEEDATPPPRRVGSRKRARHRKRRRRRRRSVREGRDGLRRGQRYDRVRAEHELEEVPPAELLVRGSDEPQEPRGRRGHPRKPHREGLRPLQALQPVGIDIGKR